MLENNIDILALINGCIKNNRLCQRDLYNYLHGYAASICYRYVQHQHEIEELLNESFIKLFNNMDKFEATRTVNIDSLFKGWFKRIIVNTCIDYLRKQHTLVQTQELIYENDTTSDHNENGLDKIEYKEILKAIKLLSPVYWTVFNLYVIEGYSHDDIAKELNISVGASKSNLSKARANLRNIITEYNRVAI